MFGKNFPAPPTSLTAANATLSVQAMTLRKTDVIELLIIPGAPTDKVKGNVILERTEAPEKPFVKVGRRSRWPMPGHRRRRSS